MNALKFLIKYIDLGLPSNTLWAEANLPNKHCLQDVIHELHDAVPTLEEFKELFEHCKFKWDRKRVGYKVTGPNGNSIFLPVEGREILYTFSGVVSRVCDNPPNESNPECRVGYYWTSTFFRNEHYRLNACFVEFNQNYRNTEGLKVDAGNPHFLYNECMSVRTVKRRTCYEPW